MKLKIGRVLRAHGVKGWVRLAGSEALAEARQLWVGGILREVEHAQGERGDFLVKLHGIDDRDAAEALRGADVELPKDALPALGEDEVYVADLVGCTVFDAAGARLGEVTGSFPGGGHEVLEVKDGAREFLLPLVEPIVTHVDVAARRIVCDPPPGLIDLDEADSERS
jgi:16S rRNA processing protein RimM